VWDGTLRARYRDSLEGPALLTPGRMYRVQVDLWSTAQAFKAEHRLCLHVTGGDFRALTAI
jgi:predicted acyl esterase